MCDLEFQASRRGQGPNFDGAQDGSLTEQKISIYKGCHQAYSTTMNAWFYLSLAIISEVVGTTFLKLSDGFTHAFYTVACLVFFVVALYMLSLCVKHLDISIVYAIWSGVGITLISIIGVVFFHEQITFSKLFFIALIITGVIGLQLVSQTAE